MTDLERPLYQRQHVDRDPSLLFRATFTRHAHKEVFDPHAGGAISQSGISKKGRVLSEERGALRSAPDRLKIYTSRFERSKQTATALKSGLRSRDNPPELLNDRPRPELDAPHFSPKFIDQEYRPRFLPLPSNYEELDGDLREQLTEDREAPAVDYWLDLWDRKFDEETESAKEVAERVASWFIHLAANYEQLQKLRRITKDARPVPETDNITHKTLLEPLIKACVIPPLESIAAIGGPLNLLESVSIVVRRNAGHMSAQLEIRGKTYTLDWEKIEQLNHNYEQRLADQTSRSM